MSLDLLYAQVSWLHLKQHYETSFFIFLKEAMPPVSKCSFFEMLIMSICKTSLQHVKSKG